MGSAPKYEVAVAFRVLSTSDAWWEGQPLLAAPPAEDRGGADHLPPETQTQSGKHDLPQGLGHLKAGLPAVQQGL